MKATNQAYQQRLLLFGGTFDPIHFGHINIAEQTAHWLNAESVHLIPAHIPPHKTGTHATSQQRKAMVEMVANERPLFTVDTRELLRITTSYTIDTLREIKLAHPNKQLIFIMGMDSLLSFHRWHCWQEILSLCHLVVNIRPGFDHHSLTQQLPAELSQALSDDITDIEQCNSGKILLHYCTPMAISSTQIRQAIMQQQTCNELLPDAVHQYIQLHKIYQ